MVRLRYLSTTSPSKGAVIAFLLAYVSVLMFLILLGHYHIFYLIGWTILALIFSLFFIPLFKSENSDFPWFVERSDKVLRLIIFLMAFSLRAIFLLDIPSEENGILSEDVLKYSNKSRRIKNGKLPYRDFDTAYGPLHNYLIGIASFLATKGPDSKPYVWDYDLAVVLMFKLLACICDSVSSVLVFEIGRLWNLTRDRATLCAFGYASNPLSILEFGWSGHNDAIVVMLVLLSLYTYLRADERSSAILLAAATAIKYWPVFYMLLFVGNLLKKENGNYRAAIFFLIYVTTGILISLPFLLLAPVEFALGVISLAEGGGNTYVRLSFLGLATEIVMQGFLRPEDEATRNLVKAFFSIIFYLGVLAFIAAFALTQRYPHRLSLTKLFKSIHVIVIFLLGLWGLLFVIYAIIDGSPLIIFGFAMFSLSIWLLKRERESMTNDPPFPNNELGTTSKNRSTPGDPIVEAIMWTGFLLVLVNATYHAWYYTWLLPVFFIVVGKKPSYADLVYLIFLHQPTSYVTTKIYYRSFWP
ncbi:MAG: hypothetical protein ACE5OZ_22865 [Candidatus Heimdallarchaeota archaeon]